MSVTDPAGGRELHALRLASRITMLLVCLTVSAFTYYSWGHEKKLQWERLQQLTTFAANSSDLFLDKLGTALLLLSQELQERDFAHEPRRTTRLLQRYVRASPAVASILLVAADGHIIASSHILPGSQLPDLLRHSKVWHNFQACTRRVGLCIGDPHPGLLQPHLVVPLRYPVYRSGHLAFTLVAVVPFRNATRMWGHLSLPPGAALGLINAHHYLIARWPLPDPAQRPALEAHGVVIQTMEAHPDQTSGHYSGYVPLDHRQRLGVYQRLPHYPMTAFVSVPVTRVVRAWWHSVQVPLLLGLVLIFSVYFVYRWALKRQTLWQHERLQSQRQLSEIQERAHVTLQSIADGVITAGTDGHIDYLNPMACRLTGWSKADALHQPLGAVYRPLDPQTHQPLPDLVAACLAGSPIGASGAHVILTSRDGRRFAIEHSAAPLRDREGTIIGIVIALHDVTEKRLLADRLAHQATHDMLTDLPNRSLFHERLQQVMRRGSGVRFALIFIDLDGFKSINDTYGHHVGDRALVAAAERIGSCLGEHDLLARYGGDEFAVLVNPRAPHDEITGLAQRILESLQEPIITIPAEVFVSASLGIAFFPTDAQDPDLLCRAADAAMYEAKASGKHAYRIYDQSRATGDLRHHALLDTALRYAVDRGEFRLVYQPEIDLKSGRIVAAEALIRWEHPTLGTLLPAQFIPLAEENGLIVPIGAWVLHTACQQNQKWRRQQLPPITVAVNVSGRQFRTDAALTLVADVLKQSPLPAEALQIELTESLLIRTDRQILRVLETWRDAGVSLAIDDFGTGYSSLSYLKHLPVDTLKIDHSFMVGVPDNAQDNAIIRAIVDLGHSLGIRTVAEGVETEAQLAMMRTLGCDSAQGFAIARPMTAAAFEELLRRRAP